MRRAATVLVALAVLVVTSACHGGATELTAPNESNVKVDTPAYRALKAQAGIEDCPAAATTDGGLPSKSLPCLGGGRRVDLSTLKGPLLLNFWAASCGPCRKEMPALQDFHEQYGDQVPVVGVDYQDQQPAAALELARKSGVTYPLLADPGGDLNAKDPLPAIRGLPYLLFLDADGELTVVPGGIESADDLVALLGENLGIAL